MKKPIEVIAVYYPHWHVYPKGNEWFHPGWTEWEYVKDAVPRFPGHRQPIVPLPGYLDGANPVDVTPRCRLDEPYPWRKMEYPYTMTITDNTPDAFRELLAEAKAFAENDPKHPGAVYINGWNEYTEGTYLLPDAFDGDARLRAIASVFAGTSMESQRTTPNI